MLDVATRFPTPPLRVVVVGGSSQSTPALFAYLAKQKLPSLMHFVLLGRSRERGNAILGAVQRLSKGSGVTAELRVDLDEGAAFEGARVILIQARIGGYRGRIFDESFSERLGICGDETLGPGGLSAAWRAWPEMERILNRVSRFAGDALVVMLSSPVGLLVRAARTRFPDLHTMGICELPWTTLLAICRAVGAKVKDVDFDYQGLSHFGWFHGLKDGRRNLLQTLISQHGSDSSFPTAELMEELGGFPTKYLRLHFQPREVLEEKKRLRCSRAESLQKNRHKALRVFEGGSRKDILQALQQRPAPWYEHAVGPFLCCLAGDARRQAFFLSVPNRGYDPTYAVEDILEIPHYFDQGEFVPRPLSRWQPTSIDALLRPVIEYERLATTAVLERDSALVSEALAIHPWVDQRRHARSLSTSLVSFAASEGWAEPPHVEAPAGTRFGPWHACSYLPGRLARTHVFSASRFRPGEYQRLLDKNFRRNGTLIYQPFCATCEECRASRIPVKDFKRSRSQRRCWKKNRDLEIRVGVPRPSEEKKQLYFKYLKERHDRELYYSDGYFERVIYKSPVTTLEIEYRLCDRLVAVTLADREPEAMSAVSCFFDSELLSRAPGIFNVLWLLDYCKREGIPYLHLGHFVAGCQQMSYKKSFRPLELLQTNGTWQRVTEPR